jgi:hypothetical protein
MGLQTTGEIAIAQTTVVNVYPLATTTPATSPANIDSSSFSVVGLTSIVPFFGQGLNRGPFGPIGPIDLPYTTVLIAGPNSVGAVVPVLTPPGLAPIVTAAFSLPSGFVVQQNGIAAYQRATSPSFAITPPSPIYVYVLCSNPGQSGPETVFRYQMTSTQTYQPAGLSGDPNDATFIAGGSTVSGMPVLLTSSASQGLACSSDGVLAVADGPNIWLFDAETGAFSGAGQINLGWFTAVLSSVFPQYAAYALAFGPDGNLYVLVGSGDPSLPQAVVLRFLGPSVIPQGLVGGNPLLLNANQIPSPSVALAVGGSSDAPIIYVIGTVAGGSTGILTYTQAGKQQVNNFPLLYNVDYCGPVLFNVYTDPQTPFFG